LRWTTTTNRTRLVTVSILAGAFATKGLAANPSCGTEVGQSFGQSSADERYVGLRVRSATTAMATYRRRACRQRSGYSGEPVELLRLMPGPRCRWSGTLQAEAGVAGRRL